jgi:hypothetical protein
MMSQRGMIHVPLFFRSPMNPSAIVTAAAATPPTPLIVEIFRVELGLGNFQLVESRVFALVGVVDLLAGYVGRSLEFMLGHASEAGQGD